MPPVFDSAEWNATCALRPVTLRNDSTVSVAYFGFTWFILLLTMVYVPVSLIAFIILQRKWVYLKKRSLFAIICAVIGTIAEVCLGPLRDITGRASYPCEAGLWLRIIAMVGLAFPVFVKLIFFRDQLMFAQVFSQLSFTRLQQILNETADKQESRKSVFYRKASHSALDLKSSTVTNDSDTLEKGSTKSGTAVSMNEADIKHAMYRQSLTYKVLVLSLPCLPLIIVGFILEFTLPYYYAGHCIGCDDPVLMIAVLVGTCGFIVLAISITAYALRKNADPLNILYDLKVMCVGASVIGTPGLIGLLFDKQFGNIYDRGVFSWDWLIQLAILWFFTFLCPVPIYVAYKMSVKVNTSGYDLRGLLSDAVFQKIFMEHLVSEWAVENLRFIQQVESYKEHYDVLKSRKERNRVAEQTFRMFIKPGAVLEVNISALKRDHLVSYFSQEPEENAQVSKDVFDQAEAEIIALLDRDSFRRFQITKQFKEYASQNLIIDPNSRRMVVATRIEKRGIL